MAPWRKAGKLSLIHFKKPLIFFQTQQSVHQMLIWREFHLGAFLMQLTKIENLIVVSEFCNRFN